MLAGNARNMARWIAEEAELKRTILAWVEKAPGEWEGAIDGDSHGVLITACRKERIIKSIRTVATILGKAFWLHVTVPLKVLDSLLPAEEVEKLVIQKHSGSRMLTTSPRFSEMKKAA